VNAILVLLPDVPWSCLMDDASAHRLPTLVSLIESGSAGCCPRVGPHPVMDGIVATGQSPEANGLLTRSETRPDGFGIQAATADCFRVPTIWDLFDADARTTALVNLRATSACCLSHGTVVSDAFFEVASHRAAQWHVPVGSVAPVALINELIDLRLHPEDLAVAALAPFLNAGRGEHREASDRLVIKALAENAGAHAVATHLLEHHRPELLMVRYPALAQLHGTFPVAMPGVAAHATPWAFLELIDAFVARLRQLAAPDTVMLVCGGTESAPFWIAEGPSVTRDALWPSDTSLYDVAPTLLALAGLRSTQMVGQVPANMRLPAARRSLVPAGPGDPASKLDLRRFEPLPAAPLTPGEGARELLRKQAFRTAFARAEIAQCEGRREDAVAHYRVALERCPEDPRTLRRLADALADAGEHDAAAELRLRLADVQRHPPGLPVGTS